MIIKIATTNNKINEDDTLHTLTDSAYIYSFLQYALHTYICYSIFQIAQSTEKSFLYNKTHMDAISTNRFYDTAWKKRNKYQERKKKIEKS